MTATKVFKSGNSMAVRLPASFGAVPGTTVEVREEQGRWIVEPVTAKIDLTGIWGAIPGFMSDGRGDIEQDERDWGSGKRSSS